MPLPNEIKVPQAVIFDQETEKLKKLKKDDQTGTQASSRHTQQTILSGQKSFDRIRAKTFFFYRFEGGGHTGRVKHGIEGFPTLDKVSSTFSLQSSLSWFDMVLAALDCYTWVFGENLLTPADLFGSGYHFS